jgi:hypothetical protein
VASVAIDANKICKSDSTVRRNLLLHLQKMERFLGQRGKKIPNVVVKNRLVEYS